MNTEDTKAENLETCKQCGERVKLDDDGFCPECGTRPVPLPGEIGTCKQCGEQVKYDKDGFCPKCSTKPTSIRSDFETCTACGKKVKFDKDGICPKCATPKPIPVQSKNTEPVVNLSGGERWKDALIEIMCAIGGFLLLNFSLADQLHLSPATTKGIDFLLFIWLISAFRRFL